MLNAKGDDGMRGEERRGEKDRRTAESLVASMEMNFSFRAKLAKRLVA